MATGLKHHHLLVGGDLDELSESGIKPLNVAHLQQPARSFSGADQIGGLLLAGRNRLFNQHIHARLKAGQAHPMVQEGRNSDTNRIDLREHGLVRGEPAAAKLLGCQGAPGLVRVCHPDKLSVLDETQHPGVVPTHVANANDTHTDRVHGQGTKNPFIIDDQGPAGPSGASARRRSSSTRSISTRSIRGPSMATTRY